MSKLYIMKIDRALHKRGVPTKNLNTATLVDTIKDFPDYRKYEAIKLYLIKVCFLQTCKAYKKHTEVFNYSSATRYVKAFCTYEVRQIGIEDTKLETTKPTIEPTFLDRVKYDVVNQLDKDVLSKMFKEKRKYAKQDDKYLERLDRLSIGYQNRFDYPEFFLGGYHRNQQGAICFLTRCKLESVTIELCHSRRIVFYKKEIGGSERTYSLGGSVSSTTLKELKEALKNFAQTSPNKNYWLEVHKLLENAL